MYSTLWSRRYTASCLSMFDLLWLRSSTEFNETFLQLCIINSRNLQYFVHSLVKQTDLFVQLCRDVNKENARKESRVRVSCVAVLYGFHRGPPTGLLHMFQLSHYHFVTNMLGVPSHFSTLTLGTWRCRRTTFTLASETHMHQLSFLPCHL